MRITIQILPLCLLVLALPLSLVKPFNIIEVLVIILGAIGIRVGLVFHRLGYRATDKRIILETTSVSHYCEKIRWCLDYLNVSYIEEEDSGILGLFIMGRTVPVLKIPGDKVTIGNSAQILRYLYGEHCSEKKSVEFLQPTPERLRLEKKFDKLGFNYRVFAYYVVFSSSIVGKWEKEVLGLYQPGVPEWQKLILKIFSPVFRITMKLNINAENGMKRLKEARETINEVDQILSDGRKTLLGTAEPTYLDFHFSSMIAIMLRPPDYGGGILTKQTWDPNQKDMPQRFVEEKEYLMKTRAGKLAMNMYEHYRHHKLCDEVFSDEKRD